MTDGKQWHRELEDRPKSRCVAEVIFDSDVAEQHIRAQFPKSIPKAIVDRYIAAHRQDYQVTDHARIASNIRWTFDKVDEGETVTPNRFNGIDEGALYTAKEEETAKAERFHYLSGATKPFGYVLFSLDASTPMMDIRTPLDQENTCKLTDDNHEECRVFASSVRKSHSVNGLISPSVRNPGGSCCTFFSLDGLSPGEVLERGEYQPKGR
ncbi:RES family NAD+ phosphorylase [uncultured Tateyamaria sp.]|uniref:RES family NAD+ phosphorylase n=1 Tax=uncultured Tateyamaria sp. TaxID=455651 RepID=UPI00260D567F|nr:RES family NAD+ phosphorylase [uncultured Tateyamaria sp.]